MLLHDAKELHHHLRRGADENLALTAALSVDDAHEGVVLFMCISFSSFVLLNVPEPRS